MFLWIFVRGVVFIGIFAGVLVYTYSPAVQVADGLWGRLFEGRPLFFLRYFGVFFDLGKSSWCICGVWMT